MLNYYAKAFNSMWTNPTRLEGRSWFAELICRALKAIMTDPEHDDLPTLRKVIDAAGGYHPAVRKTTFEHSFYGGVRCVKIAPSTPDARVLVYFHGGGYVFGSPTGYRGFLAQLAVQSQSTIIAVDYRLSPEHPYPAAQDDALAATKAVFDLYPDHTKIIAGDSAGGALSITTTLSLQQSTLKPDACVLLPPWVNPWAEGGSVASNSEHDFLTAEWLSKSIYFHLNGASPNDQLNFESVELAALPPTLVDSGGGEIFHDQIVEFVARASGAGVSIQHHVAETQYHVYPLLAPLLKDSRISLARMAKFIQAI